MYQCGVVVYQVLSKVKAQYFRVSHPLPRLLIMYGFRLHLIALLDLPARSGWDHIGDLGKPGPQRRY